MCVDSFHNVAIGKFPASSTLGLVESKVALECGAVGVKPLAVDKLSVLESSDVLLACLEENVGSLSIFLSIGPVAGVNIFIEVSHDALSVSVSVFPVAVVLAHLRVHLFANSVLAVVNPSALILDGFLLRALLGVSVVTLSVAFLNQQTNVTLRMAIIVIGTYTFEEVTGEGVAIGVVGCALSIVVA